MKNAVMNGVPGMNEAMLLVMDGRVLRKIRHPRIYKHGSILCYEPSPPAADEEIKFIELQVKGKIRAMWESEYRAFNSVLAIKIQKH